MKKKIISLLVVVCLLLSFSVQTFAYTQTWPYGPWLVNPTGNFKVMTVRYESPDAWYTSGETSVKQWHYFKDVTSAIKFADSLAYTNADNVFYSAISTAIGIGSAPLGITLGAWWCFASNDRNTLISNLKNVAYNNNGRIYVSLRWFENDTDKRTPYIDFGAWDGSTLEPGYLKTNPNASTWPDYLVYAYNKY